MLTPADGKNAQGFSPRAPTAEATSCGDAGSGQLEMLQLEHPLHYSEDLNQQEMLAPKSQLLVTMPHRYLHCKAPVPRLSTCKRM